MLHHSFSTFQCRLTKTKPGDLIDNDCDGKIDEEKLNGEDDDNDGQTDEDLELVKDSCLGLCDELVL